MSMRWRAELLHWLIVGGMWIGAGVTWAAAPDRIPVHWDLYGEVNRYGGKVEGLIGLPLMASVIYLALLLLPRIDPGRDNYRQFAGAYSTLRLSMSITLAAVYAVVHLWIRGQHVAITTAVPIMIGLLLIVVGNTMGKIRPNWFVGIRTPWTLTSKRAWVKTHRAGGWLLIADGVGLMVAGLSGWVWGIPALIGGLLAGVAWLWVYSYRVWRADPHKMPATSTLPA